MANDKQIIALLLDALEDAYIDRVMFMTMIMTYRDHFPQIGDWVQAFRQLKTAESQNVKKQFSALREAVRRSRDVEQALAQFLKDTLPRGPVH
jgi:hypothetical protein